MVVWQTVTFPVSCHAILLRQARPQRVIAHELVLGVVMPVGRLLPDLVGGARA